MNRPEYNRKMKGLNRDLERLAAEIDTLGDRQKVVWAKRASLILDGWGE